MANIDICPDCSDTTSAFLDLCLGQMNACKKCGGLGYIMKEGGVMTRSEHLDWCKKRALEYVGMGDTNQAFASMGSDLRKHPETANHSAIQLGMMLLIGGKLDSTEAMRKFIEGFN